MLYRRGPLEIYAPELERILEGIGRLTMSIDANLRRVVQLLEEDEGEEEADT